jgi:hypothetical protein
MPKIFGLNIVGVLVASVAFFLVGWVWYGMLFSDAYMAANGVTEADAGDMSPAWMASGFVITLLQVIGIGLVLKWKGASGLVDCVKTAVIVWFFFALPFATYAYIYMPAHNSMMLMIDAGHLLVGWVVSAAVLALIK